MIIMLVSSRQSLTLSGTTFLASTSIHSSLHLVTIKPAMHATSNILFAVKAGEGHRVQQSKTATAIGGWRVDSRQGE